jgi:hypothetical protein
MHGSERSRIRRTLTLPVIHACSHRKKAINLPKKKKTERRSRIRRTLTFD